MKLSKTQALLLAQAAKHHGKFYVCFGHEGRKKFGRRAIDAANKLVELGMAEKVSCDHGYKYTPGWGITGHYYDMVFKVKGSQ